MQNVNIKNVFFQKWKDIDNKSTIEFVFFVWKHKERKTVTIFRNKFRLLDDRDLLLSLWFYLKDYWYNVTWNFSEIALFFSRFKFNFDNYYI